MLFTPLMHRTYRQLPIGVVFPRDAADVEAALAACRATGAAVLPRGYERLAATLGAFHFLACACLMLANLFRLLAGS